MPGQGSVRGVLVIIDGAFAGTRHELLGDETIIGRNPNTDITLVDESISREHAIVAFDQSSGSYTLEDLQSTNGTKVNGKRVRSAELTPGDEIEIGHTKFKFLLNSEGE